MFRSALLWFFLGFCLSAASQTDPKPATPAPGAAPDAQLYRNTTFGFRYKIPYGWVDRTQQMRERESAPAPDAKSDAAAKDKAPASARQGEVLLAVFERPPEAIGDTVNSAVVIAAESAAAYSGLRKAEDYLGPLTELTTAKGFKPEGDPDVVEIDARRLIRADFSKPLSPAKDTNLTMRQSTLVMLSKGQIVSFTFIAGSGDEIDDLIENLGFAGSRTK